MNVTSNFCSEKQFLTFCFRTQLLQYSEDSTFPECCFRCWFVVSSEIGKCSISILGVCLAFHSHPNTFTLLTSEYYQFDHSWSHQGIILSVVISILVASLPVLVSFSTMLCRPSSEFLLPIMRASLLWRDVLK